MKEIWPQLRERWKGALKRYQYVLLVMAAGVLLMMLPMGPSGGSEEAQGPPEGEGQFDLELFEEKLSQVLSDIQGAGKTRVVLTLKSGSRQILAQNVERSILAEELKMSCTNVLLQCLDAESRCIFVLGTMFKLDSRIAGEILDMTPEAYRKRLSRIRRKVADFLSAYCGEYGEGQCRCMKRVDYAIQSHRLNPAALDYTTATEHTPEQMRQFKNAMEEIDDLSARFAFCKTYQSPERTRQFFREFLASASLSAVTNA